MTTITIRRGVEGDLADINRLLPRQDAAVLAWMLRGSATESGLHSFVAVHDDRIVGHAGYTLSRFVTGTGEATGVHVVNWVVTDECRGQGLGARLFRETFACGDFSYHFSGTEAAERLYPLLGFRTTASVSRMVKVLDPIRYYRSLSGGKARNAVKALIFGARSAVHQAALARRPAVDLEPYEPDGYHPDRRPSCILNAERPDKIAWLAHCPVLDNAAFNLRLGGDVVGVAVCYVKTGPGGIAAGRIAHVSLISADVRVWYGVLRRLEGWFRQRGCATVSTYACHPGFVAALTGSGYMARDRTPIWLRDPHGLIPHTAWHITGLEGDVGYRHF